MFDWLLARFPVPCAAILASGWLFSTWGASAEEGNYRWAPPGVEIRQITPQLDPASVEYRYDRNHVTDNESVSVLVAGNDVVAINVKDGTVRSRAAFPSVPPFSSTVYLRTEGEVLYLAYKEFLWSQNKEMITLRVLDLATGVWQWSRSVEVTQKWNGFIGGASAAIAFHAGEIRVTFTDGQMARWRLSDMANLPTYYFDSGSIYDVEKDSIGPGPSLPIGVSMGDSFIAGISEVGGGLVNVKSGKSSVQQISLGSVKYGPAVSSRNYLVTREVRETSGNYLFQVWDLRKPTSGPLSTRQVNCSLGLPGVDLKIWKDRYLLAATTKDGNSRTATLLEVYDLQSPSMAPLQVQLPVGMPGIVDMGIIGRDFWFITDSKPALIGWVRGMADTVTMAAVHIDDAKGAESTGVLNFKVHVDGNFTTPVTVHLKSRSGSAKEELDYTGYDQTLTLTPQEPSTVVQLTLRKDTELENYESMLLETVEVNHAWVGNRFANGIIKGASIAQIETLSAPPGVSDFFGLYDWALTQQGVVASGADGEGRPSYYLKRPSSADWEKITSLSSVNLGQYYRIVAFSGNRVCASVYGENPAQPWELKYVVVDLAKDQRIAAFPSIDSSVAMNISSIVTLDQSRTMRGYDLAGGNLSWSMKVGGTGRITCFDDATFLSDEEENRIVIRSYADGGVVRSFPRGPGQMIAVSPSDGGFAMFTQGGIKTISNFGPDGHRWWMFPEPYVSNGGLISDSFVLMDDPAAPGIKFKLADCVTGAILVDIAGRRTTELGAAGGKFGLVTEAGKLAVFQTHSLVPSPLETQIRRGEDEDPSTWKIDLAEAAAFPVTVRLLSGCDDIQANSPVVIPAGSLSATFPASVVKDGIPEYDETIPLSLAISGNGEEAIYQIRVTIPRNEYVVIPNLKGGNLLEGASSVGAHHTGIVVGTIPGKSAVDPIYKKIYRSPKGMIGYGASVACNEKYIATGALDLPGLRGGLRPSGSKIFLYDRKSAKLAATFKEETANSGLGAVLHMDSSRLIAGAPGRNIPGTVLTYDFKTKKTKTLKEPGPKNANSRFGASVTSLGDQVWIGAPRALAGKVYQFNVMTGKLIRVLAAPDVGRANFGTALEIFAGKLVVGAPKLKNGSAVFLFDLNSGKPLETIESPFQDGGNFGASLAVPRKDVLAVGCPGSSFAPEGGVLLYHFPSDEASLISMLRSSSNTEWSSESGLGYLGGMGAAGGMAGVDSIIAVSTDGRRSQVDLLGIPSLGYTSPRVGLISLVKFLPPITRAARSSARLMDVVSSDPWQRTLGPGATADDCRLELRRDISGFFIVLPDIASIAAGASLNLEESDDLIEWTSIATLSSASVGWRLSSGGKLPYGQPLIPISVDQQHAYFRIRCEAP